MNHFFPLFGVLLLSPVVRAAPEKVSATPTISSQTVSSQTVSPALFSDAERAKNLAFWNAPHRYEIGPRPGAKKSGVFVVRLTPEASIWFKALNGALQSKKVAAPKNALEITPATQGWEDWVAAKLQFDRALAARQAEIANAQLLDAPLAISTQKIAPDFNSNSKLTPKNSALPTAPLAPSTLAPPTAISPQLPPHPGPIPLDLLAAVGNAPPFAAPVAPLGYAVRFESGEAFNYTDYIPTLNPRYPSFRFARGVASIGTPLSKIAPDELERIFAAADLSPSQTRVMRAVSALEGGFDSINTYDTGFVSVGFIQFAALEAGNGSLGALLQAEKTRNASEFARDFHDFGVDVSGEGVLVVVDPSSGAELRGGEAVRKIIDDKRLIAVFHLASRRSVAFRAAQIEVAKTLYYPADLPIEVNLGGQSLKGLVRDVVKSEAGMATLFDRKVNVGNIRVLNAVLAQLMSKHNLTRFEDVAPFERELIAALKWRRDFLKDATLTQPA